jgi:hypothetical protein
MPEARFVSLANALCHEYSDVHPGSKAKRFLANKQADLARLHTLIKASSGLARVGTYISDLDKRKKLLNEIHKSSGGKFDTSTHWSVFTEAYELDVKIFDDEKALGLVDCIGSRPRPPIGN